MTRRGLPRFMQLASISLFFSLPCGIDLVLPSSSSHPTLILSLQVAPCYGKTRGRPRNTARVYVKTRLIFLLIFSSQTIVPLPFSCVRTHTRGEVVEPEGTKGKAEEELEEQCIEREQNSEGNFFPACFLCLIGIVSSLYVWWTLDCGLWRSAWHA